MLDYLEYLTTWGIYLLAATGLMAGRKMTTHWSMHRTPPMI